MPPNQNIDLLSLFPDYFQSPLNQSLLKRAVENQYLTIRSTNIRDFASGKHKVVDDTSFGGGPGMVLMPEPIKKALHSVRKPYSYVICPSPQGTPLTPALCKQLAKRPHLIFLCGHYEGIDERILEKDVDEEISIGDYVLTNGCLAALVILDALVRFIPGVVGTLDSIKYDSFENSLFDYPHYTKPRVFEGQKVPQVLLEGNHKKIQQFRHERSLEKTKRQRPDLYWRYLSNEITHTLPEQTISYQITLSVLSLETSALFYTHFFYVEKKEDVLRLSIGFLGITLVESTHPSRGVFLEVQLEEKQFVSLLSRLQKQEQQMQIGFAEKNQLNSYTFEDINGIVWHISLATPLVGKAQE